MNIVDRAIVFATEKHSGALRKSTKIPYILHPLEVAAIVATMTDDYDIIAAAALHDVVEDAGVTKEELAQEFGGRVASLVAAESENKREGQSKSETWRVRKEEALETLRNEKGIGIKMIPLADKLSNLRQISRDYPAIGETFWDRFNVKDKSQHA